jgi:hypothetical protein
MHREEPQVIAIPPKTQFDRDEQQVRSMEEKRQRAIQTLGAKWCLHNPRPPGFREPFIKFPVSLRRLR